MVFIMLPCGVIFIILIALMMMHINSQFINRLFCWYIAFGFIIASSIIALFIPGDNIWIRLLQGVIINIVTTFLVALLGTGLVGIYEKIEKYFKDRKFNRHKDCKFNRQFEAELEEFERNLKKSIS